MAIDVTDTADADKKVVTSEENVKKAEVDSNSDEKQNDKEFESVEDALAEVARLREINNDIISSRNKWKTKAREFETADEEKAKAALEEQGQFKELYEKEVEKSTQIMLKLKDNAVNGALEKALADAGAEVNTALKLVDKSGIEVDEDFNVNSDSLKDIVSKLQEEHAILFTGKEKTPQSPKPKRAHEEEPKGGYIEELKALQKNPLAKQKDFDALRAKYGRK